MKPEQLRQAVQQQYGDKVVHLIDRYAQVSFEEACDYEIGRRDRYELHQGQLLSIKQSMIAAKGPIVTARIHVASLEDREALIRRIDDFHDVDDKLQIFEDNFEVQLDSESSELFVYASEKAAPAVIAELEKVYPGIRWTTIPQFVDMSYLTVAGNWPQAKQWLKAKYAETALASA